MSKGLENYDQYLKAMLVKGFTHGFDTGYRGQATCSLNVSNLKSTQENPDSVTNAIQKELLNHRMSGPFENPPFDIFQISPIGLVPKKTADSFRMIINLSSPKGQSINDNISDIFAAVRYSSLLDAIRLILACGPEAFLAKTDIQSAFRLLALRPDKYHLFVFSGKTNSITTVVFR